MKQFWVSIVCILLFAVLCAAATPEPAEKHVLLLFNTRAPDNLPLFLGTFAPAVRARVPGLITFHVDYIDPPPRFLRTNFSKEELDSFLSSEAETFRRRYAGLKLDLVVATSPGPLEFSLQYRDKISPGAPIVFMGLGSRQFADRKWPAGVTGVMLPVGLRETIDLALRLEPDTENVAVISALDPFWIEATQQEILRYQGRVKEILLLGPASYDLFKKVVALPPHTVVLFHLASPPFGQPALAGRDLIDAVSQRIPTFSAWDFLCLDHGCIGGVYADQTKLLLRTAEIASRVLLGTRPDDIPVVDGPDLQVEVDARSLSRWHIPESRLPPGSQVLYREPSLWEQGRKYFLTGIAVIVVQALLIFGLFWHRARRRKAEIELGKSEQKFSKSFRQSPLAISIASTYKDRYLEVNETFEELTGWRRDEVAGRSHTEIKLWVDLEHRSAFLKQLLAQGSLRDLEIRIRRKDGQIRTTLGSAELIEVDGEKCCLSVWTDITERKQAEEALASVSHKLIEAQEKERARIARELHDDINQQIALATIEFEGLKQRSGLDDEVRSCMSALCVRLSEIGKDVQAISHRLHSSKLEILGVVAACRSFCREVAERNKVTVDFTEEGNPRRVPEDVSLCLFRILQESLNNAIKHSGAQHFEVRLRAVSDEIQLTVRDCGVGFDAPAALSGHGLGLISMRERASLVKGTISITSRRMAGTEITLRVPIALNRESQAISGAA
jgi:PAS domain S-box-containing protein